MSTIAVALALLVGLSNCLAQISLRRRALR
jgi:hypothetical protein